jgi:formiminotetrahydrofolate cyclodeaminase
MKLKENTILSFLEVTAGKDPVPGGGSISALCGSLASALAEMVTGLTIGRKKYVDVQEEMEKLAPEMASAREFFLNAIDEDAEAYNIVFNAFKLPKETEEDKALREVKIQESTLVAAMVPLSVARKAVEIMPAIETIAQKGNKNAITDCCVAMMCARTAALGAILNVRINITSLTDTDKANELAAECDKLQAEAVERETALLSSVKL